MLLARMRAHIETSAQHASHESSKHAPTADDVNVRHGCKAVRPQDDDRKTALKLGCMCCAAVVARTDATKWVPAQQQTVLIVADGLGSHTTSSRMASPRCVSRSGRAKLERSATYGHAVPRKILTDEPTCSEGLLARTAFQRS